MYHSFSNKRIKIALAAITLAAGTIGITGYAAVRHAQKTATTQKVATTKQSSKKKATSNNTTPQDQPAAQATSAPEVQSPQPVAQEPTQEPDTATTTTPTAPTASNQPAQSTPAPVSTTGVSYDGRNFDLASFSGVNGESTPRWTNNVFKWTAAPNYYLAEQASAAGIATQSLTIGSPITVEGHTYHITSIDYSWPRANAKDVFAKMPQHGIGLQTCAESTGTYINIYWAD